MPTEFDADRLAADREATLRLEVIAAIGISEGLFGLCETLWNCQRDGKTLEPELLDAIALVLTESRSAVAGLRLQFDKEIP